MADQNVWVRGSEAEVEHLQQLQLARNTDCLTANDWLDRPDCDDDSFARDHLRDRYTVLDDSFARNGLHDRYTVLGASLVVKQGRHTDCLLGWLKVRLLIRIQVGWGQPRLDRRRLLRVDRRSWIGFADRGRLEIECYNSRTRGEGAFGGYWTGRVTTVSRSKVSWAPERGLQQVGRTAGGLPRAADWTTAVLRQSS